MAETIADLKVGEMGYALRKAYNPDSGVLCTAYCADYTIDTDKLLRVKRHNGYYTVSNWDDSPVKWVRAVTKVTDKYNGTDVKSVEYEVEESPQFKCPEPPKMVRKIFVTKVTEYYYVVTCSDKLKEYMNQFGLCYEYEGSKYGFYVDERYDPNDVIHYLTEVANRLGD